MSASCVILAALLLVSDGSACSPRALDDAALDRVTAGSAQEVVSTAPSGGVVAVGSLVNGRSDRRVTVIGSAQRDSRAANAVNAAGSATAGGVNIWQGALAGVKHAVDVEQRNDLAQDLRRAARLGEWTAHGLNVFEHTVVDRSHTFAGHVDSMELPLSITTSGSSESGGGTAIQIGSGFAGAGAVSGDFSAGGVALSARVETTFSASTRTCFLWWCSTQTESVGGSVLVEGGIDVPELSFEMTDGVGCAAVLADCSATGATVASQTTERIVHAPGHVAGASAEYIAVGGATLNLEGNSSVTVRDSAQQGMRALNLTNASLSAIANAVNVGNSAAAATLRQGNLVVQGR